VTLAFRAAEPDGEPRGTALLIHGYPESSYMWRDVMESVTAAGFRAVAPDLLGLGDSPADPPGTWERHVAAIQRFVAEQDLGPVVVVVHDWGGMIGLAWACEHPDMVRALVISNTGFFHDGKWHGFAQGMRTPGQGEELVAAFTREGLEGMLKSLSPGIDDSAIDEYWKGFEGDDRRTMHLDFYRSMDFEKLAPYEGRLAQLGVPTLLLWGANDAFAPVAGAHRFKREIPHADLCILDDAGHFVFDDAPERAGTAINDFLGRIP
jgi:haloalkane dehalogenase